MRAYWRLGARLHARLHARVAPLPRAEALPQWNATLGPGAVALLQREKRRRGHARMRRFVPEEAAKTVLACLAGVESYRTGRPVKVSQLKDVL